MAEYIGVYRVQGELGQGGMGEVFLAWDERLDRPVAIKRVRHDAGLTDVQRERLRREARLAARLSHPAIVQVHDLVVEAQGDAIVMEYVEGRTLRQHLAAAVPGLAETLRLAREIAEGLAAAHAAGLIHRDLKSDNIVVTLEGHAKILDFGLARPVVSSPGEAGLTREGLIVGTCHAMSPEQTRGGELDGRSDLFSFGALLYEMLTGRPPFRGRDAIDSLRKVALEDPPPLIRVRPDVPAELSELVERLLAKDRDARPRNAREVTAVLERLDVQARLDSTTAPRSAAEGSTDAFPIVPHRPGGTAPHPHSRTGARVAPWKRRGIAAAGLAAALAALLAVTQPWAPEPPPLRVLVLPPSVDAGDESLAFAGASMLHETMQALVSFQELRVIDPEQLREAGVQDIRTVDAARITDADEVLVVELQRSQGQEGVAELRLKRFSGSDAAVLWMSSNPIPVSLENPRLRRDMITNALMQAYPEHPPRQDVPQQEVSDEDYLAFMAVWRRLQAGEVRLRDDLRELERIVRGSPDFLEAQLHGVRVALFLFQTTYNPELLTKAQTFAKAAHRFDPKDSRTLVAEFEVALAGERDEEAEDILEDIERLLPGDPEVQFLEAQLAEYRGQLDEAVARQQDVVDLTGSWKHIGYLAKLEARRGKVGDARELLEDLLRREPENPRILAWVAENELLYGDLGKAEQIYRRLLTRTPERASYTNLGMALFLGGRYRAAESFYRKALQMDSAHPVVKLNLADVLVELRRQPEAAQLYREVLEATEAVEVSGQSTPWSEMMKAQCLARLGRNQEAVQAAQRAMGRAPDSPDLHQEAALVYSLTGDRNLALESVRTALDKGIRKEWFHGSAFTDPELRSLLDARSGRE